MTNSVLKAEDSSSLLLQQFQQNSFSIAPSATIALDAALQSSDSRGSEIAKRLKDTMNQLKAGENRASGTFKKSPVERGKSSPPSGQVQQYLSSVSAMRMNPKTGTPRHIHGKRLQQALEEISDPEERAKQTGRHFLRNFKNTLHLTDPDTELRLYKTHKDELDRTHLRYEQMHQGLRVWPAELMVHLDSQGDVDLMTGSYVRMPRKLIPTPLVKADEAQKTAQGAVLNGSTGKVSKPDLIIYAPNDRMPRLAWKMTVNVAFDSQWVVIIDAVNGAILEVITQVMEANVAGSGVDLFGTTRPLNVWEQNGNFFLVDTSKPMFDPSSIPPDPTTTRGGIIILDAQNQPPTSNPQILPNLSHVTSNSATSGWLPDAVSAAFNFSETYDYYLNRHNRNSLDGKGGNISAVVRLGQNFQNAIFSSDGNIMYFGDGLPYARALDVVAHELTHGVTHHTANLMYMDQSGALNEAFSDVFGEMVQARTKGGTPDWILGGPDLGQTFRDFINPNSISCGLAPCPSKMSQYIITTEDNGGVHLNSSIINHAFYLLAQGLPGAIGLIDAEKIFYRALTTKLVPRSEFIDARLGAITSAEELFGANSNQVQRTIEAFDAVEIVDAPPTPAPQPFPEVSGSDATIFGFFDDHLGAFFLGRREEAQGDPSQGSFLSVGAITPTRPSVTGAGTIASFVDSINDQCFIPTDGSHSETCIGFPGFFSSVTMSPDGNRFAMVLRDQFGNPENTITLNDLAANTTQNIPLVAPLLDGGTIEVLRADTLDFSADGNTLFYDAFNRIQFQNGSVIGLWSIYALNISTGLVTVVIPPISGFDIANPAISQTSDQFLTFEAVNQATGDVQIVFYDLFTGTFGFGPTVAGATFLVLPGYTGDDSALVYTAPDATTPTGFSLFRLPLGGDHITPSGPPNLWLPDALAGVIYRRGTFSGGQSFTLNVVKNGQGEGLVLSTPSGIVCGNNCQASFPNHSTVTLTASPSAGSSFTGWTGGGGTCSGTTNPCSITMTTAQTVTATFNQNIQNQAPSVNAGLAQTVPVGNTATLDGTVSDDGLPNPPGVVTILWSKVSGPGVVIFGDPKAVDTFAAFTSGGTYVLRLTATDGALSTSSDVTITARNQGARGPSSDVNGDGKADIVWRNANGATAIWFMNGTAIGSSSFPGGVPLEWQIAGVGDVHGDGKAEVIWHNSISGTVAVWVMDGGTITFVGFPGSASTDWKIEQIGDVDGNGAADIVWRNSSGVVAIWLMNGTIIASAGFLGGVPAAWQIAGMGDVNADGKADVIWRNSTSGTVAVWVMDGVTITAVGFPGSASTAWKIEGVGDVSSDGKADIIWRNTNDGATAIWLMNGTAIAASGFPGGTSAEWKIVQVGDVDGDGKADIFLRNSLTSAVEVWIMNGLTVTTTGSPGAASTDWEIQ